MKSSNIQSSKEMLESSTLLSFWSKESSKNLEPKLEVSVQLKPPSLISSLAGDRKNTLN
jgi:hypothetical protein